MKKSIITIAAASIAVLFAAPAFAQPVNNTTQLGVNSVNTGSPSASSSAIGVGSVTTTNTNVGVNAQDQAQRQRQQQGQQQGQLQGQEANNNGNHQKVNFEGTSFDRYAPSAAAPALTAAGTGVCLGSISGALMGPMAGIGFGKTTVDKGCESRSGSALLMQYAERSAARREAFENASLRVLAGESLKDALAAEGLLPAAPAKAAKAVKAQPVTETVVAAQPESTNFGARVEVIGGGN